MMSVGGIKMGVEGGMFVYLVRGGEDCFEEGMCKLRFEG